VLPCPFHRIQGFIRIDLCLLSYGALISVIERASVFISTLSEVSGFWTIQLLRAGCRKLYALILW
jgi:hypothetical protein